MVSNETITVKPLNLRGERAVFLTLPDAKHKQTRYIGYIKGRTFFTSRNTNNQKFQRGDAIGMNYKLLKQGAELFDFIVIQFGLEEILQTKREYFLKRGYILNYVKNGLDKQIFLKLSDFGIDKVRQDDAEQKAKPNLNRLPVRNETLSSDKQGDLFNV